MKHATTRMIFAYWDALRGERSAPERGEIEPGEIRHVLADTFVLEVAPERTATIRLAGTRICAFFGRELRGEAFDRLWHPDAAEDVHHAIEAVVEEAAGVVAGLSAATEEGASAELEMILLPLRHRGQPHARILGALSPAVVPPWIGLYPRQPAHDVLATRAVALGPARRGSCAATTTVLRSRAGNASSSTPEDASEPAGG